MAAPAPHGTQTLTEHHWAPERHGRITSLCDETVASTPGIRSLSHFGNGILDFVVCRTDRRPLGAVIGDLGDERDEESLPGSRLLLSTQDIGVLLQPLGTGELMRTVVSNREGCLWGGRVKPGEYLAAVTDTADGADAMDTSMNALVTRIRREVHRLSDELPGGDRTAKPGLSAVDGGRTPLRVDFGTAATPEPAYEERLRALWLGHVNTTDLQYAAYYRDWTLVCAGDVFESDDLGPKFLSVSVRARRTAYRELSRSLRGHLIRLADALGLVAPAQAGRPAVERLVLDVQEGAVYLAWTSSREFLVGVTLDQTQVANADAQLQRLAGAVRGVTEPPR
ncbi:hypothetical protein OG311_29295 [Streptomyces sp. NBC_01343]|uniref:hypothetical protein n=1 Tax=Streptomyces sp. NBC_01343 TaxID=2903832 RepID=UPI002E153900|nr:hypothetical protein OG311_29295 [Streptomyces sp. NBC_01343]